LLTELKEISHYKLTLLDAMIYACVFEFNLKRVPMVFALYSYPNVSLVISYLKDVSKQKITCEQKHDCVLCQKCECCKVCGDCSHVRQEEEDLNLIKECLEFVQLR